MTTAQTATERLKCALDELVSWNKHCPTQSVRVHGTPLTEQHIEDQSNVQKWHALNKSVQALAKIAGIDKVLLAGFHISVINDPQDVIYMYDKDLPVLYLGNPMGELTVMRITRPEKDRVPTVQAVAWFDDYIGDIRRQQPSWWVVHPQERFF